MVYVTREYHGGDSMASLICENHQMLIIVSRFGIELGFGDKTVEEVCKDNDVDCATFLAVVNLLLRHHDQGYKPAVDGLRAQDILVYLLSSHAYYLEVRLPAIREKLLRVMNDDVISTLLIRYFDDFVQQIKTHLRYEEEVLFPYVQRLENCENSDDYSVDRFVAKHDNIDEPLSEFKDVIIKYHKGGDSVELTGVIHDILHCSNDLMVHNIVEDRLLVPLIRQMENQESVNKELSQREREIVKAIALGMSNKEIAAELFISTHTVMTHRKNIAAKLKIHNPAGLTIYAIMNKLIDVKDLNDLI